MDPVISGRGAEPVYRDNKGKVLMSIFSLCFCPIYWIWVSWEKGRGQGTNELRGRPGARNQ